MCIIEYPVVVIPSTTFPIPRASPTNTRPFGLAPQTEVARLTNRRTVPPCRESVTARVFSKALAATGLNAARPPVTTPFRIPYPIADRGGDRRQCQSPNCLPPLMPSTVAPPSAACGVAPRPFLASVGVVPLRTRTSKTTLPNHTLIARVLDDALVPRDSTNQRAGLFFLDPETTSIRRSLGSASFPRWYSSKARSIASPSRRTLFAVAILVE